MRSKRKRQTLVIRLIFLLTLVFTIQHQSKLLKKINLFGGYSSHILLLDHQAEAPVFNHNARETIEANQNLLTAAANNFDSSLSSNDTNLRNAATFTPSDTSQHTSTGNSISSSTSSKPCALLFFGLITEFANLALPAIQQHIIQLNPTCDIFLHTYNITVTRISRRMNLGEQKPYKVRIEEAYQLTNHVVLDTDETFEKEYPKFLRHTRRLYHREWGPCCRSHDNMIKQWHSIKRVWDLMEEHERKLLQEGQASINGSQGKKDHYYEQIGLFRSDVFYMSPIDIFDSNNATLPNFASYRGYNDRLFIGQRQYAKVWADRFSFAPTFEKKYMVASITRGKKRGYHSESFLYHLLNHHKVPVEKKNICVWRIRRGSRLAVEDCTRDSNWFTKDDIPKYLPQGYTQQVVTDVTKLRNGRNKTSTSLWGFPPGGNGDANNTT